MGPMRVVLLTDTDSLNQDGALPYKYHGQKLWQTVRQVVEDLQYRCDSIELNKLDFQEHESMHKYVSADIVIMVKTFFERKAKKPVFVSSSRT